MKRLLINIVMIGALLTSCVKNEAPKFDDKDATANINTSSISVSEDAGVVKIPVTVASLSGLSTTVTYEVIDGTAKAGENFSLKDGSASLVFDANNRSQNIEINIVNKKDEFTGDLSFTIKLSNTGSVLMGADNTCKVTITDLDHPLASILGDYTMTATKYKATEPSSWTLKIMKDKDDVTKVWLFNMFGNDGWAGDDMLLYGIVNAEKNKITIPCGQKSEYKYDNGENVIFYGLDADGEAYDTGNWEVTIGEDGSLDFGDYGIWAYIPDAGSVSTMMPPMKAVK
jgi:Calx-beta domain.